MTKVRSEYRFVLTRRQRLVPHLGLWAPYVAAGVVGLASLLFLAHRSPWVAGAGAGLVLFFMRGFFFGLAQVVFVAKQACAVAIEEKGIGFGEDTPESWVFADGIIAFGRLAADVWTIQHHNGTVLHVPVGVLSRADADFLSSTVQRDEG